MNTKDQILDRLRKNERVTQAELVLALGLSRSYIARLLKELQIDGSVTKFGGTKSSFYVLSESPAEKAAKTKPVKIIWKLENKGLNEDVVWSRIKANTEGTFGIPENVVNILGYAFEEMLNNAIEHSKTKVISIVFERGLNQATFEVSDSGVGILNNIQKKKKLKSQMEAIQELLKGKQTTAPEAHSGQGIFFTSRVADYFEIFASGKKIIINNDQNDLLVKDNPKRKGTRVIFRIKNNSKKVLRDVFNDYSDKSLSFSKTNVRVKLFEVKGEYLSRSEARRLLANLEQFNRIVLDFKGVENIGQAFADEVFRVWQKNHPKKSIEAINQNDNVDFMIKRAMTEL